MKTAMIIDRIRKLSKNSDFALELFVNRSCGIMGHMSPITSIYCPPSPPLSPSLSLKKELYRC
jgi:hypothetical protein